MHWKLKDKFNWHRWFAWFPVAASDGDVIWFEVVETRLCAAGTVWERWEYRRIPKEPRT